MIQITINGAAIDWGTIFSAVFGIVVVFLLIEEWRETSGHHEPTLGELWRRFWSSGRPPPP